MPATISIPVHQAATPAMDTRVSIQVVTDAAEALVRPALQRALGWFTTVENSCSRCDSTSELGRLVARPGEPVHTSPVLFEAVRFALSLARATGGVFDPTTGAGATFRHVRLGPGRTITLRQPLGLDLGAVATGLAIDLAACELAGFDNVWIEAGGVVFAGGEGADAEPWRIGIRAPYAPGALATTLAVSNRGVCTVTAGLSSVSVIAPTAMAANGLATAALRLGPDDGRRLLDQWEVDGVFITPAGGVQRTGSAAPR
jgi:thiamine biosynthesis lipoprotein